MCLGTILNTICIVINAYLLAFVIKSKGCRKAVKKPLFWIFMLCEIMNVCLLTSDTLNFALIDYTVRRAIMISAWTLRSLVLILICIFFFHRSRKLVHSDDASRILKVQYIVWGATGCVYLLKCKFLTLRVRFLGVNFSNRIENLSQERC